MPSTEHERHDADEHKQDGDPEPTERGRERPDHEEAHPHDGDRQLSREQNQPEEKDPTLCPAREPGCKRGLVGVGNAPAVLDRTPDPRPSRVIEAILEGEPPLRVASLLNPVVHTTQ